MKRGLILSIVALLALFLGAVILIYNSIGSIITAAVEEHGSQISGTKVTLAAADFTPSEGHGVLTGLKVGNPPGFTTDHALSFDSIFFEIDIASLNTPVIIVREIRIVAPEVIYEIGVSDDNLRQIKANIDKAASGAAPDPGSKRIIVEKLYIEKGAVWVSAQSLQGKRQTAVLNDIQLENLGNDDAGVTPARLVQAIMAPLMREVTLAAMQTDLGLDAQTHNLLKGVLDESESAVTGMKKQGAAALEALGQEAARALDKLEAETGKAMDDVKRESSGFFNWLQDLFGSGEKQQ